MPSTIRTELDRLGFDWENGCLVAQAGSGHQKLHRARIIEETDPILDLRFANGAGFLDVPRVLAGDDKAMYVVYRNERGTGLRKIYREAADYVDLAEDLPYPDL